MLLILRRIDGIGYLGTTCFLGNQVEKSVSRDYRLFIDSLRFYALEKSE